MPAVPHLHTAVHEPLLGTRVSIGVRAASLRAAEAIEGAVVGEFQRLEALLSAYRPSSAWSRWRAGDDTALTAEVVELLQRAAHWHHVSGGAFNPGAGVLRARWMHAERDGSVPAQAELAALAHGIHALPYRLDGHSVVRTGDCRHLDLHAIAKGWIVDRAVTAGCADDTTVELLINAGGDLRHVGGRPITVGIEDPRRPYDNAPPMVRVSLGDGALAGSSGARRPLVVNGERFSHVLDPRTGQPVHHTVAASALAVDACTADVAATIVGVLPVSDALAWCEATAGIECHLLDAHGREHTSSGWPQAHAGQLRPPRRRSAPR